MEPRRFQWMKRHLANNSIDPHTHELLHGAIGGRDGYASFAAEPNPDLEYGTAVSRFSGHPNIGSSTGELSVPCYSLATLLSRFQSVDLLHMDIQGQELNAIAHDLPCLRQTVRFLFVETHSRWIHVRLRNLLTRSGFTVLLDYRPFKRQRTPFGDCRFREGMLGCEK